LDTTPPQGAAPALEAPPRNRWIPILILAVLATLSVGWYLYAMLRRTAAGFVYDDAWITLTIARNLAHTGMIGFHPGQWGPGSTSLLWVLLLALGEWLGCPAAWPALVLGGGAYVAAIALLHDILAWEWGSAAAWLGSLSFLLMGPLRFLALSGMETALVITLGLAGLWFWQKNRPLGAGVVLGLLLWTRFEGLALVIVVVVASLVQRSRRRGWIKLLAPITVALAAEVGLNLLTSGSPLPGTWSGRRWLWGMTDHTFYLQPATGPRIAAYFDQWRVFLHDWTLQAYLLDQVPGLRLLYLLLTWGLLGLALMGCLLHAWHLWRRQRRISTPVLFLSWTVVHTLVYLILAPVALTRYQIIYFVALAVLAAAAVPAVLRIPRRRIHRIALGAPVGVFLGLLLIALGTTSIQWAENYGNMVRHINDVHIQASRWIDANLPQDAVVAAFDIGAVGYFGQRAVVDLGGLTDPAFLPYLYEGRTAEYMRQQGVTHLAMVEEKGPYWIGPRLGIEGKIADEYFTKRELARFETDPYIYTPFDRPIYYCFYPTLRSMGIYEMEWHK